MKQGQTLADILRGTKTDIVIPRLQRNYAQGRKSAEDIREAFANDIVRAFTDAKPLSVDYIYGRSREYEEDNELRIEFVALDGQQRLTTFFLLHWLLAIREHASDAFLELFSHKPNGVAKSRFCYKTRKSANDFCNLLIKIVEEDKDIAVDLGNAPSAFLKNRVEYHLAWVYDSTVQGMLNMLDALHDALNDAQHFAGDTFPPGAFNRLVAPPQQGAEEETRPIFFYLIDDGITTSEKRNADARKKILVSERQKDTKLFITMNSRGLPLTAFENFKAELGIFLNEIGLKQYSQTEKTNEPCAHFLWKMDTVWADFFWKHRIKGEDGGNLYDNAIMNFIRLYWLTCYAGTGKPEKNAFEYLENKTASISDTTNALTFARLRKKNILPAQDDANARERFKCSFIVLEKNLDAFAGMEKLGNAISSESQRYFDLAKAFDMIISGTPQGYAFNILWYAYSQFAGLDNAKGIDEWLRVIWNLVENTRLYYDNYQEYCRAIQSIDSLLTNLNGRTILEYLSTADFSIAYGGFRLDQMAEERIKAWLICHDTPKHDWRQAIIKAEGHPYFKGQIGFLLTYAGLSLDKFPDEEFAASQEFTNTLRRFVDYYEKTSQVFMCVESNGEVSRSNDAGCCFERAVLCKGNYLKGTGKHSLRSKDIRTRNIKRDHSWSRFLRDDKNTRDWVREVLDDPRFDKDNVEDSLNRICSETTVEEPWRNLLIHSPELFEYCKRGFIYRGEIDGKIILFGTEQFNQFHVDMFLKYLECSFKNHQGIDLKLNESKSHDVESSIDFLKDGKIMMTLVNIDGMAHFRFKDDDLRMRLLECHEESEKTEITCHIVEAECELEKILKQL